MITSIKETKRTKVNFMIDNDVLIQMKTWVVSGERSDFVNEALEKAVLRYRREKAFKAMDELREKANIHMTDAEIIKLKNYGRP